VVDTVERLGDGGSRRRRLLSRVQRHGVGHERGRREQINPPSCSDDAAQRPRYQEPLRDPLGPREHQSFYAGQRQPLSYVTLYHL